MEISSNSESAQVNNVLPGGRKGHSWGSIHSSICHSSSRGPCTHMYTPQHRQTQIHKIINTKTKIKVLLHSLYFPPFRLLESEPGATASGTGFINGFLTVLSKPRTPHHCQNGANTASVTISNRYNKLSGREKKIPLPPNRADVTVRIRYQVTSYLFSCFLRTGPSFLFPDVFDKSKAGGGWVSGKKKKNPWIVRYHTEYRKTDCTPYLALPKIQNLNSSGNCVVFFFFNYPHTTLISSPKLSLSRQFTLNTHHWLHIAIIDPNIQCDDVLKSHSFPGRPLRLRLQLSELFTVAMDNLFW